ncbi:MAG TPA: helix-turn-helix domain-containing protein [Gaiellaceae bacterium]|nr:helix-turn-helix domain-containing protein [Gaiellaceae bacterium]
MSDFRHEWRAALTSETSPATSTQRLVGLMLADYANRENALAWPSAETISRRCALSDRAVRTALHELVELCFLAVAREGKGTSTTYQLILDPGTTFRPTPERRSDLPRKLTTPTPERRSQTPEARSDEPLRRGEEPKRAHARATPSATSRDTRYHCPFCHHSLDDRKTRSEHILEEHADLLARIDTRGMPALTAGERDEFGLECHFCDLGRVTRWRSNSLDAFCHACLVTAAGVAVAGYGVWDDETSRWEQLAA